MGSEGDPAAVSLPPAARLLIVLAGLVLMGMLAVLVAVLLSLEGTRSELRTTRIGVTQAEERSQRLSKRVQPLLEAAAPLIDESSQRSVRRTGQELSGAAREVPPLAENVRRGVGIATFLAQTLHAADLQPSLAALRTLTGAAVPAAEQITPAIRSLLAELDRGGPRSFADCDRRLRVRPLSADGQVSCLLQTVPNIRTLLRSQRNLNAGTLETQKATLAHTRQINQRFGESLTIQREILERIRSLDTKTGGQVPATGTSPP